MPRDFLSAVLYRPDVTARRTVAAERHGIIPGDINRQGDACTDFFDYANGAWRKANPIPEYMDRWSRRWQSGEVNKEHVREILDEVSARKDWPAGSAEQLSGDFYGAFDKAARELLKGAEERALANKRKTLRPQDL